MKKIKVGIVNYLNTVPLIYGLKNSPVIDAIELIPDYPANLAKDLLEGTIDLGLVPVAVIPQLKQWWLMSDYCIGCKRQHSLLLPKRLLHRYWWMCVGEGQSLPTDK